jgi:hypothetical protein
MVVSDILHRLRFDCGQTARPAKLTANIGDVLWRDLPTAIDDRAAIRIELAVVKHSANPFCRDLCTRQSADFISGL